MILFFITAILTVIPFTAGAAESRTAGIEIVCSGLEKGDRALYEVYGPGNRKMYSVALTGNGKENVVRRRVKGLEPGVYRVVPAGWNWTYVNSPGSLSLQLREGETAEFSFGAVRRSGLADHYEEGRVTSFR